MNAFKPAWAIVHASTGKFIIVDARVPMFWLRRPAQEFAWQHGFTTGGTNATAKLMRVAVSRPARARKQRGK